MGQGQALIGLEEIYRILPDKLLSKQQEKLHERTYNANAKANHILLTADPNMRAIKKARALQIEGLLRIQ